MAFLDFVSQFNALITLSKSHYWVLAIFQVTVATPLFCLAAEIFKPYTFYALDWKVSLTKWNFWTNLEAYMWTRALILKRSVLNLEKWDCTVSFQYVQTTEICYVHL